jgi:hypothetical protein
MDLQTAHVEQLASARRIILAGETVIPAWRIATSG